MLVVLFEATRRYAEALARRTQNFFTSERHSEQAFLTPSAGYEL